VSGITRTLAKIDPIGKAIGLYDLFEQKTPTRRLGDLAVQTAQEGGARPIIWGRVRPIGGNIIHIQSPQKRIVKEKVEGGKGGGKKKKQKVEHVFRTYAIGICEGPVSAVTRAWRNDKLVYDARGNAWGAKNNPVFLQSYRFYLGKYDQLPDPALESIWGIGNVPAYRGTCYMVAINEDLTDLGGAVPQWTFEVERAEFFDIQSALYPLSEQEGINSGVALESAELRTLKKETHGFESVASSVTLDSAELKNVLQVLHAPFESVQSDAQLESAELKSVLRVLNKHIESVSSTVVLEGGTLQ